MRTAIRGLLCGVAVLWGVMVVVIWCFYPMSSQSTAFNDHHSVKEIQQRLNLHQQLISDLNSEMKLMNTEIGYLKASIDRRPDLHQPRVRNISTTSSSSSPYPVTSALPSVAVLMTACNRESITRAIDSVLLHRDSADRYPLIVSQDCQHQRTSDVIKQYGDKLTHIMHPDQSGISLPPKERKFLGYYKISRHYKWALTQVFDIMRYKYVIIVEDDLELAPDFFQYMSAGLRLLQHDPSLWCVSAWNDNGKDGLIDRSAADLFYRSDFFPGLGWMMSREVWQELKPKWPPSYWDDWMREPNQRKDRACIRPEISRSKTFGKKGVSQGQFYEQHLKYIVLNDQPLSASRIDVSHLMKDDYERTFVRHVLSLPITSRGEVLGGRVTEEVRVEYTSGRDFQSVAKQFRIMNDLKAKVPRTAYQGIVSFMYRGHRVHLSPPQPWRGYNFL